MKQPLLLAQHYLNSAAFKKAFDLQEDHSITPVPLAMGEYNMNFRFQFPDSEKIWLFRINTHSQMGLEKQITYEYEALKLLEKSHRTPQVIYVDDTRTVLPHGVLIMAFLEGKPLVYDAFGLQAAQAIFADIHSLEIPEGCHLIRPQSPAQAMVEECRDLLQKAIAYQTLSQSLTETLNQLLNHCEATLHTSQKYPFRPAILNTEVNSSNFLIGKSTAESYLIDWEKPIISDPAQDLAHFLAPTTTFWKTDTILSYETQLHFIQDYQRLLDAKGLLDDTLVDRCLFYLPLNCLRGLTWCAMAYGEYTLGQKLIQNQDTFDKIKAYLSEDFIGMLKERYFI